MLNNDWLGDGQTRRYRFVLQVVPAGRQLRPTRRVGQQTAQAIVAYADVSAGDARELELTTGSLGLLGGPIAGPANAWARAEGEYQTFWNSNFFGTFGSRGDPLPTGTTGTPRNGPLSQELAHAVQAGHHRLISVLEEKAWIQALRAYHLYGLTVRRRAEPVPRRRHPGLPGLARSVAGVARPPRDRRQRSVSRLPHARAEVGWNHARGWEHFDHEHWTTDLLFDYWTISGDCWAQEELRQMGQSLKSMMRLTTFATRFVQAVRAEGWTMQGFVQCYLATGDQNLRSYAMRRVNEIVDVQRLKNHPSKTMGLQENYGGTTWPMNHEFFMTWQHGAVLYGYLGAYRHWAEPKLLEVCEDVVDNVEYSWVTNYQDPQLRLRRQRPALLHRVQPRTARRCRRTTGTSSNGIRFGDSPLGGAHVFLVTGLLAAVGHVGRPERAQQGAPSTTATCCARARWVNVALGQVVLRAA